MSQVTSTVNTSFREAQITFAERSFGWRELQFDCLTAGH
jgi:hypothetical protein